MKKIISFALILGFQFVTAQEKIDTYEMARFEKEPYSIQATSPKDEKFNLYIDMQSLDASVKSGGIILESDKIELFHTFFKECQNKLEEWDAVADSNDIADLTKDIPTSSKMKVKGYFRYGDWNFAYGLVLRPKYFRSDNISQVVVYTGEMTASDNRYTTADNFVFAFSSEEITDFLSKIKSENVIKHFTKKESKEDLFK